VTDVGDVRDGQAAGSGGTIAPLGVRWGDLAVPDLSWGLPAVPSVHEVQDGGEAWSPERTVAASGA
jgi:hypothetical protein